MFLTIINEVKFMSNYKVILHAGIGYKDIIVNMPRDKARNEYEYISKCGLQAVIERCMRTRAYRKYHPFGYTIHTIIRPDGEEIDQF